MQLDKRYGVPVRPQKFSNIEANRKPSSLFRLDDPSGAMLAQYLDQAINGWRVTSIIHETVLILWVMTADGTVWFSVEEMYKAAAEQTVVPLIDGLAYPPGYEKLGHPALIAAAPGRIGGEIIWDVDASGNGSWLLTNKSGRYGLRTDLTAENLGNVAQLFGKYGVVISHHFINYQP